MPSPSQDPAAPWSRLQAQARIMQQPQQHLRHLLSVPDRLANFSVSGGGLFYDFSRQRLDTATLDLLLELARERGVLERLRAMQAGALVNVTEKRAALHTACRDFTDQAVLVEGRDVMGEIRRVRDEIRQFAQQVHGGQLTGTGGKPFKHAVVIGIGGSYLGVEFISEALAAMADRGLALHFLANVDIHNFGRVAAAIEPETTLWVVISKSYTTVETEANMGQALELMAAHGLDPRRHLVAVTSKGSPGDDPANPRLRSFHMFDFIGGRYSVTSAVGGVPLSLALGYERFEQVLQGAAEMDRHAAEAPPRQNLPLLSALVSVWNTSFMGFATQAIIPYAQPLHRLSAHVQQLNMESNGKGVTAEGAPVIAGATGPILFGEPGTNAQHSFFQLAHQGRVFPIEFIGVLQPQYGGYNRRLHGVTNHQELWANLIAQPMALALGQAHSDPARAFEGNRPSSTLLLRDLSPASVGRLLAYYEARTVFEAFIWGINPFDQFGVELGKKLAGGVRQAIVAGDASQLDPVSGFYVKALLRGELTGNTP